MVKTCAHETIPENLMKYTLAVFFCVLSVTAVNAQARMPVGGPPAVSETPAFPPPPSVTPAPVQQEPVTPIIQDPVPCQRCANNGHPFFENRLYRWAITDWEQSPGHYRDTDHLTWWFIPRPRALIQAICP
jgi:hypothetical protein